MLLRTGSSEADAGALSGRDAARQILAVDYAFRGCGLADLLDVQAEIARLTKEKKRLEGELKRSAGMLRNEKFLSKAPADKIAAEKEKQQKYEQQMAGVLRELEELSAL